MHKFMRRAVTSMAALGFALLMSPANAVPVSVQIGLVVDISGSVDAVEYNLQRQGYVDAFNNTAIQETISNSPNGVAVAMFYFSTTSTSSALANWAAPILSWTLLTDAADAAAFATAIGNIARPSANPADPEGDTNIANGIATAADSMMNNGFEGRMVIDVSTDGIQNVELDGTEGACGPEFTEFMQVCFDVVETQRDAAGLAGITVNAIGIETETTPGLLTGYLADYVIIGDGSFVVGAADFDAFGGAIREKIGREIIPVPAAVYLFGSALLGLGGLRRRRQAS